ncbi:MAG: UDP-3-O-(3-hydroxymyristoyl)glucosamine N-acyltransferase [Parachlamydiaceae bacterium]
MTKRVFTLEELAKLTNSRLIGDASHKIHNVADLESANAEDVSFLASTLYEKAMLASKAGAVFVSPNEILPAGRNFLVSENPSRAFQLTVETFLGEVKKSGFTGIHPSAVIHPDSVIADGVTISPQAVIDQGVTIGEGTSIGVGCYIGPQVTIGRDCCIHPNVTIRERCQIGNRVTLQPGAIIGSCGFGYTTDAQGKHTKLNQVGIVILEDDVEIGANTTIDRSRFKSTIIGQGSKIDNLVQIGHGVIIGPHTIIVAQVGIAGSTKIGAHVVIAGHVAIAGHLSIADGVMIAGKSGVTKSITKAGKYGGTPAVPIQEYNRNTVYLRNIESYLKGRKGH